jgi:fucose permease
VLHRWGWDAAIPWFGVAFFLLLVPIALGVLRAHPPAAAPATAPDRVPLPLWDYRDAVRTRFFRLVTAGFVLCMGCQVGGISHLYNRAELLGDFRTAARAVQVLTVASILGRFLGGWVLTRIPARPFMFTCLLGQALGLGLIALAQTPLQVIAGALVFGATVGNLLMLHPLFLAEAFPGSVYPRVFALSNAVSVLGVAAGPVLLGALFDGFGYGAAYQVAVVGSFLAVAMVAAAGPIPFPNRPGPNPRSVDGI